MDEKQIEQRLAHEDQVWNGPRFHVLLAVTLAIAIAVIYVIASVRTGDYTWNPWGHDPVRELPPSGW